MKTIKILFVLILLVNIGMGIILFKQSGELESYRMQLKKTDHTIDDINDFLKQNFDGKGNLIE